MHAEDLIEAHHGVTVNCMSWCLMKMAPATPVVMTLIYIWHNFLTQTDPRSRSDNQNLNFNHMKKIAEKGGFIDYP